MKVGLIDVDSVIPHLCLMKISSHHKYKGDDVSWYSPLEHYDLVSKSKVFDNTPDYQLPIYADRIIQGGTGYAIHGAGGETFIKDDDPPLPYEIEHSYPDYKLYNVKDTAYGFLTRGCPRGCGFCIVGKKEGLKSVKVADLQEFWNGQRKIVLNDPNILACKDREPLIEQLLQSKATVEINQGLDIRMLNPEIAKALNNLKMDKVHFAWDRYQDRDLVLPKFEILAQYAPRIAKSHNTLVFTLVNYDTTIEQDLDRIYSLRKLGIRSYVMVYDKAHCNTIYRKLQSWANSYAVFAKCPDFNQFLKHKPQEPDNPNQMSLF